MFRRLLEPRQFLMPNRWTPLFNAGVTEFTELATYVRLF